ncbi:MAG TPA: hypothetical protein VFB49_10870 [Patescibacteria group bacterium]|nr:hypothetical protein [Patescibacteria group bacterium]
MVKRASLPSLVLLAVVLSAAGGSPALAAGDLLFGVDRTQGTFLSDDQLALDSLWVQGEFGGASSRLVLRVPYIRVDDTGLLTFAQDAPIVLGAGGPGRPPWQTSPGGESESGLGDVLVRDETHLLQMGKGHRPALTLDIDYKWATGDREKGLGTGEADWGAGLDYVQPLSKLFQIVGAVSYQWMGSPEGVHFDDRLRLKIGVGIVTSKTAWRLVGENVTPALSDVPVYDATGAPTGSTLGVDDYRVVRGEFIYRSGAGGSTRLFVLAGLNDSSPDLGFGMSFASRAQ